MSRYHHHIFVCINERPEGHPRGCCLQKGGQEVRDRFKELIAAHGLKSQVRANNAGCLDLCERGITVVVYPEAIWYGSVTVDDVEEIVTQHIIGGNPVERLRIPDEYRPSK